MRALEAEAVESIWLFNSSLGKGLKPNLQASPGFTGDAGAESSHLQNGQSQGWAQGSGHYVLRASSLT